MSSAPPEARPATVADAYRFFVPLMFTAELMMISHAVITATLARMPDPEPVLAAYSVAFYFHATLGSPVWAAQIVVLSFIRDRASVRRLGLFGLQAFLSVAWIWALVALTPVGTWFFRDLVGMREEVAESAKLCMLVSVLVPPITIGRSLAYGLIMFNRRTILITYGTVVRIGGLALALWGLGGWLEGAVVGALALAACITVETTFALVVAARFYRRLPESSGPVPGYRELWLFSWPIMAMMAAESGVAFVLNFFLGRLPRPELAIAAFGVVDSMMRVLLSPLRNLVQTTQTLARSRADARVVVRFTVHAAVAFSVLVGLLLLPPVQAFALHEVMGLPEHIAAHVAASLSLMLLLVPVMATAGVLRGLLIASHNTGAIASASVLRIGAVALVGFAGIALGAENGAVIGMAAMLAAFATEAGRLGLQAVRLDRAPGGVKFGGQ